MVELITEMRLTWCGDAQYSREIKQPDGDGNENVTKQEVLISKTMCCMCVFHFGILLCCSLQNNKVK